MQNGGCGVGMDVGYAIREGTDIHAIYHHGRVGLATEPNELDNEGWGADAPCGKSGHGA